MQKKVIIGISLGFVLVIALWVCILFLGQTTPKTDMDVKQNSEQKESERTDSQSGKGGQKLKLAVKQAGEKGLLLLVNKENPVAQDYKPEDLAPIKYYAADRTPVARFMRKEAAEHFHLMVEEAKNNGFEPVMTTAYRDYGFQKNLYDNYVTNYGQQEADKFSAKPGQSEHQTGLAVDVTSANVNYELSYDFGKTEEGKWLSENAHEFGFILRFPEGKTDITGYSYEPWHFRYVGKEVAYEIFKDKTTLEQFIERMEESYGQIF